MQDTPPELPPSAPTGPGFPAPPELPKSSPVQKQIKGGKRPLLLPSGGMPPRKKLLLAILGGAAALAIMAYGAYILSRSSTTPTSSTQTAKNDGQKTAAPRTTGPNAVDDASLQQDISALDAAMKRSTESQGSAAAALDEKQTEVATTGALNTLQSNGDAELARRLAVLYDLISLTGKSNLSIKDRQKLTDDIGAGASDLVVLRAKLATETAAPAASTDMATINAKYRTYALLVAKARLAMAAADQTSTEKRLASLHAKLSARAATEKEAGKNTDALLTKLTQMDAHITTAKDISSTVIASVLPLEPSDTATDSAVLSGYRSNLETAATHNQAAARLAKDIAGALKN